MSNLDRRRWAVGTDGHPGVYMNTSRSPEVILTERRMLAVLGAQAEDFDEAAAACNRRHAHGDPPVDDWDYERGVVWRILVDRIRP